MASIYSTSFIAQQGVNGSTSLDVPAGWLYVVKQLTFYASSSSTTIRGFFMNEFTGATLFAAASETGADLLPKPTWAGFYGQLVFGPETRMTWKIDADPLEHADVSAHGFRFQLV